VHTSPWRVILKWASAGVIASVVVVLDVVMVMRAVYGPQHPGPGNNPDAFPVVFVNDLGYRVNLSLCMDPPACSDLPYTYEVLLASTDTENIGTGVMTTWLITRSGTQRIRRCLTLTFQNYADNPRVRLSGATGCSAVH
jgi:hypothetical protein